MMISPPSLKTKFQLTMPGMPEPLINEPPVPNYKIASGSDISSGQGVTYVGKIFGGPTYGSSGIVRKILPRKAVVDMGNNGIWNIPYYFLSTTLAA